MSASGKSSNRAYDERRWGYEQPRRTVTRRETGIDTKARADAAARRADAARVADAMAAAREAGWARFDAKRAAAQPPAPTSPEPARHRRPSLLTRAARALADWLGAS